MQTLHAPRTHPPCKHCMHHTHTAHANVTRTACTLCTANAMQTARTTAHCTHRQRALLLTHIELSTPLLEGVAAAPGLVVLLQHQHTFAHLGQDARSCQTPNAAADDHSIQILRHACGAEPCAWRGEHGAACMHPCSGRRAPSQHAACTRGARNTQQCSMHLSGLRYAPTPCATCSHEVCGVHPCSVRWHSTSTQRALCSPPACSMQPCSVHWCSARCTSTQCAIRTRAACNTHPPCVQYAHMKCAIRTYAACTDAACSTHSCSVQHGPTQHTKCAHPACNMHLCSVHWPSTLCNPTQRAIHTRAARSSQALCTRVQRVPRSHATTHCTCREHSRHPALHGPAGRDGHTDIQPHTHTAPNSPLLSTLSRTRGSVTNGRGGPGGGRAKGFPAEPSRRCASSPSSSAARHGGSSSSSSAAHMAAAGRHRRSAAARRGWGGVDAEHLAAPPGPSERGLRGAEQLIAAAAAYRHGGLGPAGSQPAVCTPPGCVPLLSAPPATPPRRAAGPQSGVHGWCVCVCVCGTCVAVQGGGDARRWARTALRVQTVPARACTPSHPTQLRCLQLC